MAEGHIDSAAVERSLAALKPRTPEDALGDSLQQVLEATCDLFSASGAGLMMLDDGDMLCALAATDEPGRLLEVRQEQHGRGPCVGAVTLDQVISTSDLGSDHRWPELVPELPDNGVRAVLGIPIRIHGLVVASLNVYRDHPHDWDDSETRTIARYAEVLEGLLRSALHVREREAVVQQLEKALENRVLIERAVGLTMGREGIDAVTAFNRLRHRARNSNLKMAHIAAELLDGSVPRHDML